MQEKKNQSKFLKDVIQGLSSKPRKISSKYFYDDVGSQIFQQIMHLPEYYLTRSEMEILQTQSNEIWRKVEQLRGKQKIEIIELGAGDGIKTQKFLNAGIQNQWKIIYRPIDISKGVFSELQKNVPQEVDYQPIVGDFFESLYELKQDNHLKLILFLGSNIGNYSIEKATEFIKKIRTETQEHDLILIGADLQKAPSIILPAYNDKQGITAKFNLNLLNRINKELQGNFRLDQFEHYPIYSIETGEAKSYLVSLKKQAVRIGDHEFSFEYGDNIHVEISKKYTLKELGKIRQDSGYKNQEYYFDCRCFYTNTIFYN